MKSCRILLSGRWGLYWPPSLVGRFHSREKYNQPISHLTSSSNLFSSSLHSLPSLASCCWRWRWRRWWWWWKETMALAAESQFHVLAVDDSLIDRKLIERLLKNSCYQVTTVDSGSKALEVLGLQDDQTNSPSVLPDHEIVVNLVITDYCMPGMTGYDLLKRIKESASLKDIPVVIMSSENVPSRINRCLEEGAEEFLLKPVQLSDMKRLKPHILKGKSKEQQREIQPPPHPPIQNITIQDSNNISTNSKNDSKKRKATEEGLSPERTRPRFSNSSMTVV